MPARSIVLHGHFYQPPRENPWLGYVEAEASAAPHHDWNRRIEQECYRAVAAARIPDAAGRIARVVNTLEFVSWDFGATLLEWLEAEAPDTYRAVLEADRRSAARTGFGNAIAAPYHHVILPLSTRRDKVTEVRWGIADFRRRFGREPDGMWLPETAVDGETLDVVAAHGIRFTILAPHQVQRVPAGGLPGRYRTAGGHEIALFVYDGPLSHDLAFGPLLDDAFAWAARVMATGDAAGGAPALVSMAADGETFGHHHRFGEMALARFLDELGRRPDARVTNYAAFLAAHPATESVELVAPSAWSCPHGVERWRSDCGCRVAPERGWHQKWRAPLRAAVEWLASELDAVFEREGAALFRDAWAARDAYGGARGVGGGAVGELVAAQAARDLGAAKSLRARALLEMEHHAQAMFTSCAWFFDDIGGLEPLQLLRYAACALELAGPAGGQLGDGFAERLAAAVSNDPSVGDGRRIFLERARPRVAPAARVGASFAARTRFVPGGSAGTNARMYDYDVSANGDAVRVVHRLTGRAGALRVAVDSPTGRDIGFAVRVAPADGERGDAATLGLADLTERERDAVRSALMAALARRALGAEQQAALCEGRASLAEVAELGLRARVEALAADRSAAAVGAVLDLVDLLGLLGRDPAFEVQTAFARVREGLAAAEARGLDPLAARLGFGTAA
ncbi:MAG TPA: DUF3536 domain-containing protein [Gemmatimonadales bacterium]|nr:DUF3536 domain-containing protein [Gemmatimonadales bacterium]